MICTSSYDNFKSDLLSLVSISGDRGKGVDFQGKCYPSLAPKKGFWKIWHDNIDKVSFEENTMFYVQQYWEQVLSKLDPEDIYNELDNSVLLCYESNDDFCHRHIVAVWLEVLLDVSVPEVKFNKEFEIVSRPSYIREYLEDAMRLNRDMKGFKSLRALYLYEKGEKLIEQAYLMEKETGLCYDNYRQEACYLRCDADMIEENYIRTLSKNKVK